MNARVTLLTLAALFVGATVCLAQNPHMGTWKLNEAKSKFQPGDVEEPHRSLRGRGRQREGHSGWRRR